MSHVPCPCPICRRQHVLLASIRTSNISILLQLYWVLEYVSYSTDVYCTKLWYNVFYGSMIEEYTPKTVLVLLYSSTSTVLYLDIVFRGCGKRLEKSVFPATSWCSEQKSIPATLISDLVNMARGPRGCVIPVQILVPYSLTVFVWSVYEYWLTVDLRLVGPRSQRPDLTGEEANLTDRPALGKGVLKK